MELGETDAGGRRSVRASGKTVELTFDTVISAVGAGVDTTLFAKNGLTLDERGLVVLNDRCESSMAGVYLAGDCKVGPKTVVKAMADAKIIARDILAALGLQADFQSFESKACREEWIEK
jgi:putative selenate reductase